jgi:hypothetical protein
MIGLLLFLAASHDGVVQGDEIRWSSVLVLDGAPRDVEIPLAVPLPEGVRLTGPADGAVTPVKDALGRVTAFDASERALDWDRGHARLVLTIVQPLAREKGRVTLGAPVVAAPGVQAVRLGGGDGAHFEPNRELGIEPHVGFWAEPRIDHEARESVLALTRASGSDWIFLTAGSKLSARGLEGKLSTFEQRSRPVMFAAAGLFASIVGGFAILHRRLGRRAEAERADAALAAEIEDLQGAREVRPRSKRT